MVELFIIMLLPLIVADTITRIREGNAMQRKNRRIRERRKKTHANP